MSIRPPELDPKFQPPSVEGLLSIAPEKRGPVLTQLSLYDDEHGTDHISAYRRARNRCPWTDPETGVRCRQPKWDDKGRSRHCLDHADLEELDPGWTTEKKSREAKLRLAELLSTGVDRLTELLEDDELAPALKLAAVQTLFDRAGIPKHQAATLDARVEVTDTSSASEIIKARLSRLSESHVQRELDAIEAASEVIEGETDDNLD